MKILLTTLALFFAFVGSSSAVVLVNPDGSVAHPYQGWADASKVPLPNVTMTVEPDDFICNNRDEPSGAFACTYAGQSIFMHNGCFSPDDQSFAELCQSYLWHEIGHTVDLLMPEWKRRVFLKITRTGRAWHQSSTTRDGEILQPPSETFADVYATCAHNPADAAYTFSDGGFFGQPHGINQRRLNRACKLIRQPN